MPYSEDASSTKSNLFIVQLPTVSPHRLGCDYLYAIRIDYEEEW